MTCIPKLSKLPNHNIDSSSNQLISNYLISNLQSTQIISSTCLPPSFANRPLVAVSISATSPPSPRSPAQQLYLPSPAAKLHFRIYHVSFYLSNTPQALHQAPNLTIDDYGALEPSISGQIMELHHSKHHQTYVNSYNTFTEQLASVASSSDPAAQIALQPLINFHGGGHINHSLFWENLAPKSSGGGEPPSGKLGNAIDQAYGSLDNLKKIVNTKLAGIQGSGWAWLVKDTETGALQVRTYANQDPVVGQFKPILGIDAWEHAY